MNDTKLIPLNQSDLNSSYTEEVRIELQKLYKTELIVKILKLQNSPISVDGRALLSMHLNDNPLPLGLDRIRNVELNYLDRLKVNEFLENEITVRTKCVVDKMSRISGNKLNSLAHPSYKDYLEVLDLEAEKRKLTEELIRLKNRKVHFMNLCAEMRTGPYQKNTVETKNAECKTLQIKAETIQKVMIHEVTTSTAHALKAVKEVESNIDTLLSLK
ncbi:uncharacterized protein LOC109403715 [Aedes albopictus]|uniref:Uncharacterized protein n=1 Tax=Aedes albopictus TaxID=7160 RepID=A0ABM1ZQF4_AEDAL|nr:uncharacterized protein LOC109403715 [Aedes albopictus]XP_019532121.2 uncharacterized protein LOC109403715 [Aedes albopictus]XP_019532122.2 uncharacterized protein LOC109403715 [Aedes albopictus]XP_019532123.2 uncharacterized protein LOC109403715 [Aedes albopictus]